MIPNREKTDVVVVGGINTDFTVRAPRLPRPGETVRGTDFEQAPGGKGANQAVAVARLGARVALVGKVGDDERGLALVGALSREGVDVRHVTRDMRVVSGAAVIQVASSGQKQIAAALGANRTLMPLDVKAAADVFVGARVVLAQLEIPLETVKESAALARNAKALFLLDPAPAERLSPDLLALVDLIRPNSSEAEVLTGIPVHDRASARRAAQHLIERGVGAVAVQAGDEGNLVVSAQGEQWLPHLPVGSIDTTGAGDAFAGALAVCLAEGRPLAVAAEFASAAAALATTRLGAQAGLPSRRQVESLLQESRGGLRSP